VLTAVPPAQGLAAQLKASMTAYYAKSDPGLKFTTVTCRIASDRTTARCNAHFTLAAKHAAGVFVVAVTGAAGGRVRTRTLSVSCTDTRSGKKRAC
jgi:hypothetical protein